MFSTKLIFLKVYVVSAGEKHTVALTNDGRVLATGGNGFDQCEVSGWTDIVAVSAGAWNTVGLRADGTVVATGRNNELQCETADWGGLAIPG